MKNCLVCLTSDHADDVPTCPFCGEASWSAPEVSELPADTTPEGKEPKARRGRRTAADDADTTPEGKDK